jgi:pimeloyl-ACP methyl ester carboxylesterase
MTAPEWFTRSLRTPRRRYSVDVDECPINVLAWGDPGSPGLVLVHGGAAHAEWWAHLAPMFAATHHVVALDLSGHGDSGRREHYSHPQWADEVSRSRTAGCSSGGGGHSLGGCPCRCRHPVPSSPVR